MDTAKQQSELALSDLIDHLSFEVVEREPTMHKRLDCCQACGFHAGGVLFVLAGSSAFGQQVAVSVLQCVGGLSLAHDNGSDDEGEHSGGQPQVVVLLHEFAVDSKSSASAQQAKQHQIADGFEASWLAGGRVVVVRENSIELADFLFRDLAQLLSQIQTVHLLVATPQLNGVAPASERVGAQSLQVLSRNALLKLKIAVGLAA